jgi:pimeloyl-ACP methyl ester carboxylesterase
MTVKSKLKRVMRRFLLGVGLTLLTAIGAGIIYEEVGRWKFRKRLPQIGQSVDIGGRSMNIFCSGEGFPAVIFDSPGSGPGYHWSHIQPEVAKFTRACWYDRAGTGWSDPGPYPRTSAEMAKDLHKLLNNAGVPPPYVLVGASAGGTNARVYNGYFTNEVAGMVLVDAAHEDEGKYVPARGRGHIYPRYMWYPRYLFYQGAARVGLIRLFAPSVNLPENPSQRTREQIDRALYFQPKSLAFSLGTAVWPDSLEQARSSPGLGDRPLIVLTAGRAPIPYPGEGEMDAQEVKEILAYHEVWKHQLQAQFVKLSTRGRQIIVANSRHAISDEAPGAVIDAVRNVVNMVLEDRSKSSDTTGTKR